MPRIPMVVVVATLACGSSEATPTPAVCNKPGPIRLLGVSESAFGDWGARTTTAADHVVVTLSGIVGGDAEEYAFAAFAVEQCGDSAVELLAKTERAEASFGVAGPWMLSATKDTRDIHWLDPEGLEPDRMVFASVATCALRVAGGLAVIDDDGTLWFHADPGDPSVEAVALARHVRVPGTSPHPTVTSRAPRSMPSARSSRPTPCWSPRTPARSCASRSRAESARRSSMPPSPSSR